MATNLSARQIIGISLAVIMVILGIILIISISQITDVFEELPFTRTNLIVTTEPPSSQQGTVFFIRASYREAREQQNLRLEAQNQGANYLIDLYDDGQHFDEQAGDGIYGGFFDSTDKPLGEYEIIKDHVRFSSLSVHKPGCEAIEGTPHKDNINFVIIPSRYNDYDAFKEQAKELISGENSLLSIEPFKSNKDIISFSVVNTTRNLGCQIGCKGVPTIICCNDKIVLEEASRCYNDEVIVLVNSTELCGSAASYTKVCAGHHLSKLALVHELGHSFAGLADEYTYSDLYGDYYVGEINAVNCAPAKCEKWQDITSGCYSGCTYSQLNRPAAVNSIMYTYVPLFNKVCTRQIEQIISGKIIKKDIMDKALPSTKSYLVNMEYDNGKVKIENILLKPVKSSLDVKASDYSVQITSLEDAKIFNTNVSIPTVIYPLPDTNSTAITRERFAFSLLLPYSQNAKEIEIYNKDRPIANESVLTFSRTCGNNICESSENHVLCPRDCDIDKDNFCQTSSCDPDCPAQKNCQRNLLFLYGGGILLILLGLTMIFFIILPMKREIRKMINQ
jgi:hypothetical protein